MSREKTDTGALTAENRKENQGRRGRTLMFFVVPGLLLATLGTGLAMMKGFQAPEDESHDPVAGMQQQPLPSVASDTFDPKTQITEPATAVPPQVVEALKALEARHDQIEQQQFSGIETTQQKPKKRIRIISHVATITRPPADDAASPGAMQANASVSDGGTGTGSPGAGAAQRRGGVFSKNTLEAPFKCMASAGTVIPLMLPEGFNTEQEGTIAALVTSDSYSRNKSCKTIPQGSVFHGSYKTEVSRGQARVSLTFSAIERPPPLGDTIMLDAAKAYERDGRAGLTGEVNSNIPWGMIIASTMIDLGAQALGGLDGGNDINIGGTVANNAGGVLRDVARDRYQKAPPSIDVGPKAISVRLDKHLEMIPFPE